MLHHIWLSVVGIASVAMGMILAYMVSAPHDVIVVVDVVVVVVVVVFYVDDVVVVVAAYLAVCGEHSQRGHGHDLAYGLCST